MSRIIKPYDEVDVLWIFPTMGDVHLQGIVRHTPGDAGDMWYIKTNDTDEIVAINPQHLYLHSITLKKEA